MLSATHDEIDYIETQKKKGKVVVSFNGKNIEVLYGHPYYTNTPRSFMAVFEDPVTKWLVADLFSEKDIVEGRYEDIFFAPRPYRTDNRIEHIISFRKKNGEE